MGVNTGEIQPVVSDSWIIPDRNKKEAQVIPPIRKGEGGSAKKLGKEKNGNSDVTASAADASTADASAGIVAQVQAFLSEAMNTELNFLVDEQTDKVVVQVINRTSGEVIRQIPQEHLAQARDKLEELRGILFDGKA